ncbi:MAG TPA: alcohol dehydrogenase catalytic domain-containing protein [Acidimicrobiales bacterium]|jgi:2-desacetyl-2-hydroxyethyl bacteriochlorophyllide A dehydrogenase|nr:alcohol dehydrogenase catalytic domain-containing protein [Acidimicrobiales bacterium]
MRAVVLTGERQVDVEQVPDPVLPGPDGVIVQVEHTAICGSDLHLYHGAMGGAHVHLGHEFVGTVVESGPEVYRLRTGDRVLVSGVVGCGRCPACLGRDPVRCAVAPRIFGTSTDLDGGQAEFAAVPAADAFALPIPDGISVEQSVLLTDILPTGYLGALRADITPGSTVAVIGLGPVGVFALQCAQLHGPARILAIDRVPDRLERAAALGAEPVDVTNGDTIAQVAQLTGGRGASSVIEAVGADATIADAIWCAAPGGTVSIIGANMNFALPIPMPIALMRSLTVRVTLASIPSTWEALIPLVATGRLHPESVFTHHMGLSEAAAAYELFDQRRDGVLKVLLDPTR